MLPVADEPSPKVQLMLYGEVPPVVKAVKVTGSPTIGVDGTYVKLVESWEGPDENRSVKSEA